MSAEDGAPFFDKTKPIGYVVSGKSWVNNHAHVLRACGHITINRFLKYYLDHFDFRGFVSGTTRLKLPLGQMRRIPVNLPALPEQQRIVEEIEKQFTRLDEAVVLLDRVARGLNSLSSRLLSVATDADQNTRALGELLREPLANGRSVPTAPTGGPSVPVLRLTSVRTGRIDLDQSKPGAWSEDQARPFLVREGDFLIARGNGSKKLVGRAGAVGRVSHPVAYPDTLIRARFRSDCVYLPFMAAAWDSLFIRSQIESIARTTAGIYKINQKDLESLKVPAPGVAEQEERFGIWSVYESTLTNAAKAVSSARAQATSLRHSILAKAFSGQLVPQDPDDEPAAILLERIRREREASAPRSTPARRQRVERV